MIPTIDLDEMVVKGKKIVKARNNYMAPPQGYVTSEEFRRVSSARIDNICREYGILL
ncbi:MAG: hypothetical protein LBG77_00030 [Dysgonamonadaceae bacterium]|jgi:hypothetical protein|nr:hypothetical protein [Dysgonamonadaceae bacterium]